MYIALQKAWLKSSAHLCVLNFFTGFLTLIGSIPLLPSLSCTDSLFGPFCCCCCQSLWYTQMKWWAHCKNILICSAFKICSLDRHCLTKASEISFPSFNSEQLIDMYFCCIPKSIWCPLLQACSITLAFCQPRLPLIIPLIVEGFPLAQSQGSCPLLSSRRTSLIPHQMHLA